MVLSDQIHYKMSLLKTEHVFNGVIKFKNSLLVF